MFHRSSLTKTLAKPVPMLVLIGAVVSLASGCSEEAPPAIESVRAIKTVVVTEPASGKLRRYSGVIEAADNSSISFEVAGNVQRVEVEVGERVTRGQELAVLDAKTFQLNVDAAEAGVRRAEVELNDARTDLDRLRRIARQDRGAISERALDQAQASYDGASQTLSYQQSRLDLSRRDLQRTSLLAPFDGVIAQRYVEPFQEVSRGQPMFDLFIDGAMQAAISIPESEIDQIYLGQHGSVELAAVDDLTLDSIVTEISKVAGGTNAFPVKLTLDVAVGSRIRPGQTAEVSLMLGRTDGDETAGLLVPVGALSPGAGESGDAVFVFDEASSTVKRTVVEHDGIRGSNLIVTTGLKPGDVVAVAGVSFLRDAQPVKLMGR